MVYHWSLKQSVYQIDCIVLFLIDDFGIHLRHLHICMTEQFGGRVEVCTERQHHRRERVPRRMECKTLVYSRRFCPWFDKNIDHCWGRQVKHMVIRSFVSTRRHPLQRFRGR